MNYTKFYNDLRDKLIADKCTNQTQQIYFLSLVLDALQDELMKDSDDLKQELIDTKAKHEARLIALDNLLNEKNN